MLAALEKLAAQSADSWNNSKNHVGLLSSEHVPKHRLFMLPGRQMVEGWPGVRLRNPFSGELRKILPKYIVVGRKQDLNHILSVAIAGFIVFAQPDPDEMNRVLLYWVQEGLSNYDK